MVNTVDATVNDPVWVTVSELARRKGVDKAAISRRIKRFEAEGLVNSRPGDGRSKLINIAEFDRAAGVATDAVKQLAARGVEPETGEGGDTQPSGLARVQAERTGYMAELARLDLEERLGKLVRVTDVETAMIRCAEVLVREIDQLPAMSDDPTVRLFLKDTARRLRETLAREMNLLATASQGAEDGGEEGQGA